MVLAGLLKFIAWHVNTIRCPFRISRRGESWMPNQSENMPSPSASVSQINTMFTFLENFQVQQYLRHQRVAFEPRLSRFCQQASHHFPPPPFHYYTKSTSLIPKITYQQNMKKGRVGTLVRSIRCLQSLT